MSPSHSIDYFSFVIEPYVFDLPDGVQAKTLRLRLRYNGKEYQEVYILPDILPWESELEHHMRRSLEALKSAMKTEARDQGQPQSWPPQIIGMEPA